MASWTGKHIIARSSQSFPSARGRHHDQCARNVPAAFHRKPHLPPKVCPPGIFGNPGILGKPVGKLGTVGMPVGKFGKVGVPFPLVGGPAGMPVGRPGMLGDKDGMVPSVGSPGLFGKALGKLGMPGVTPPLLGRPVGKPGMLGNKVGKALGRPVGKLGADIGPFPLVGSP